MSFRLNSDFYKGKKVFVTGHTGFKGSWMCEVLLLSGAEVTGYSLKPPADPALFSLCDLENRMHSIECDIRDLSCLQKALADAQPQIVIHMAAQPLVRESYKDPVTTYETNVLGTVNLCEAIRHTESVRSFVNVTTDKVYQNKEWEWGYRENEQLGGFDPYSNSKACSELVTSSYVNSFLQNKDMAVSTMRAGNVIGGGDFAVDRIIPDCIRAAEKGEDIILRNPHSIRPYQHVLEPVCAYLLLAQMQYENPGLAGAYNIGPGEEDCVTTGALASIFCDAWNASAGAKDLTENEGMEKENAESGNAAARRLGWTEQSDGGPHEANFLKLDCSRFRKTFGWKPRWSVAEAVAKTVEWQRCFRAGEDVSECMRKQIHEYLCEK
ncbi:MAG: CDP-glucose 4,6-dehydratase [Lachnospiraceae bacterium]|nr:CDP-glucose 4,6-dehydratase [Lachnospiraceae bacterium]